MSALAVASDVDLKDLALVLEGNKLRGTGGSGTHVLSRLVDGSLSRTMTGASTLTLTLEDDRRDLLRSGLFDQQLDVIVDGLWWRLVQVSKAGDQLTLTFEDRIVSRLRGITTPRKAARSSMTRAEFAMSIVRELKPPTPFICPDLHVSQPIETQSQKLNAKTKVAAASGGISPGAKLTVKGAPASQSQRSLAERALDVAASLGASERATLALIEACIVESLFSNPSTPSSDGYGSRGLLQVRDVTAAGMKITNTDPEQCVNAFLTRGFYSQGGAIAIAAKNPSWTTGQVAQNTQGSAVPGAYDKYATEAAFWLAAYQGTGIGGAVSTVAAAKAPFMFQRGGTAGEKQNSWDCLQKLASDVQWVCFAANGAVVFASETTLAQAKPGATISEQTLGVEGVDFDIDTGKDTNDATVTLRANRWAFLPGAVIVLEDCGPADGRWLVDTVDRSLFDSLTTLRLKRPTAPLAEPLVDPNATAPAGSGAPGGQFTSPLVQKAYQAATVIDAKRYPYVWGGGHAHCGTPDNGTGRDPGIGYDCTGAVCAVLAAAGMGFTLGVSPADYSGLLASSWGQEGKGNEMTVYACPDMPGQAGHGFIVFETSPPQHWGTGDWGKSWGGPGFNPTMHPLANFTPRHWPGT